MRRRTHLGLILAATLCLRGEIIDRIAVTVDGIVITESDLIDHLRIASFVNREPLAITPESKREAAQRMVEQALVRREMEISRYPVPDESAVNAMLEQVLKGRSQGEQAAALAKYGVTEQDLRQAVRFQLTMLRFIEYRFRPSVAVTDEEIERFYKEEFLPRSNPAGPPPPLEDVREEIEEALVQRHVDEALDAWLESAAQRARIRYREEAFQ